MNNQPIDKEEFARWRQGRPESIQKLCDEYPPGTLIRDVDGKTLWVCGYAENENPLGEAFISVTHISPWGSTYDEAIAARRYVHASCFRRMEEE